MGRALVLAQAFWKARRCPSPLTSPPLPVAGTRPAGPRGGQGGGRGAPPLVFTKPGSAVGRPFLPSLPSFLALSQVAGVEGGAAAGGGGVKEKKEKKKKKPAAPKLTPKDVKTTADEFAKERAAADKAEHLAYTAFHFKKMCEATQGGAAPLTTLEARTKVQVEIEVAWYTAQTVPTMLQRGKRVDKEIMLSADDTDAVAALLDHDKVDVGEGAGEGAVGGDALSLIQSIGAVDLGLEPAAEDAVCGVCQVKGRSNAPWVQCDECDNWFHFKCVGVTRRTQHLRWVCVTCDTVAVEGGGEGEGEGGGSGGGSASQAK